MTSHYTRDGQKCLCGTRAANVHIVGDFEDVTCYKCLHKELERYKRALHAIAPGIATVVRKDEGVVIQMLLTDADESMK